MKEEVKEENVSKSRKDLKTPAKKGEENKEEDLNLNDPKFKLIDDLVAGIKNTCNARIEFEK